MTSKKTTTEAPTASFDPKAMNEQFLAAVKQSSQTVIDNVATWVSSMSTLAQSLPAFPTPPAMPFQLDLPEFDPRSAALARIDLAAELLNVERDFTLKFFDALAPLAPSAPAAAAAAAAAASVS
jgi:hypothetical protein